MSRHMNIGAFGFTFICFGLAIAAAFPGSGTILFEEGFGVHPLWIVFGFTMLNLVIGMFGLAGIEGWISMARSLLTLALSFGLAAALAVILVVGASLS